MISALLSNPIIQSCIVALFSLLCSAMGVMMGVGLKTYIDVKQAKRDLNYLFDKIRSLETSVYGIPNQSSSPLATSIRCGEESDES